MTIKYTCADCGSVMKIKDEKAGTRAKCPKCKVAFVVPLQFESGSDGGSDADEDEARFAALSAEHTAAEHTNSDDLDSAHPTSGHTASAHTASEHTGTSAEHVEGKSSVSRRAGSDVSARERKRRIEPAVAATDSEPAVAATGVGDDDEELDLDMPLDVTPGSPSVAARSPEALDARVTRKSSRKVPVPQPASRADGRKASVADLMRGFDAGPGSAASTATPSGESRTVSETTGTAADALARAYQQKKDNASNPRQKEKPGSLERQLMMEWLAKVVPGILGILVLAYGIYWLINGPSYTGPPLAKVAGQLSHGGAALAGYQVRFVPVLTTEELNSSGDKDGAVARSTSSGVTDADGRFRLMYSSDYDGSCLGDHTLEILDPSGIPVFVPDGYLNQTVTDDGIPELVIDIN